MADNNKVVVELGRVAKERGMYTAGSKYYKDNIVEYRGAAYIAEPATPDGYVTVAPWTTDRTHLNTGWRVFADGCYSDAKTSGIFAEKPAASEIYVGYRYFCTNRKVDMDSSSSTYMEIITPVSPDTGGMEIIHKGDNVWVDALGRVVS